MHTKSRSLSQYIKRFIILWFAVPLTLLVLIGASLWLYSVKNNIEERQAKNIQSVAMYVDSFFAHAEEDIGFAASTSRNINQFKQNLGPFIINKSFYHRILLINEAGRVLAKVPVGGGREDFSGVFFLLSNETPVGLTPAYYSLRQNRIVVGMVRNTFYQRKLLLELNLKTLQRYISRVTDRSRDEIVFITDAYGNVIAHPDMKLVEQHINMGHLELLKNLNKGEIDSDIVSYKDHRYFMSAASLSLSDWKVVSAQKVSTLIKPALYTTGVVFLIMGFLVTMLIYGINKRLSTKVIRPLSTFTEIVKGIQRDSVSEGVFDTSLHNYKNFSELEALQEGFGRMHDAVVMRENELHEAVREKEILLKEMHHRVKNNLNVVASLLSLQSDQVDDSEDAKEALTASRNRIFSMALVHEDLYKSEKLSHVQMGSYIQSLLNELSGSYNPFEKIQLISQIDDISLDIIHAVPCGIILNELLTNAFKHAFSRDESGRIIVGLHEEGSTTGEYILSVQDNGASLPENFEKGETETLGMELVKILANQLNGELLIDKDGDGTKEFKIAFKV